MQTSGSAKKICHLFILMDELQVMITSSLFFEAAQTLAGIIHQSPANSSLLRIMPTRAEGSKIESHPN
jgi:hypothetical protein